MATKPTMTKINAVSAADVPEIVNNVLDNVDANKTAPRVLVQGEENGVTGIKYSLQDSLQSLRNVGDILWSYQPMMNAFYNTLLNMVAFVIIVSRSYENPLARWTKRGIMEYGETIEEMFVRIAKVHQFNPDNAEKYVFRREKNDIPVAFHHLNYQKFYKSTFSEQELRQAFLSFQGVADLLNRVINSMYTAMNYDEYLMTKYMVARVLLNGGMYPVEVPQVNGTTARDVTTSIVSLAHDMQFMKKKYNAAGVENFTDIDDLLLFLTPNAYSNFRVQVLATSFNRDDAELMGHIIMFDGFNEWDTERLQMLFTDIDSGVVSDDYVPLTADEISALSKVEMFAVDRDWFMIFDNLLTTRNLENGEGLYYNYWLHAWKTFSVSPFQNAVGFINGTPSITSVAVTPSEVTANVGTIVQFGSTVEMENFAQTKVAWSVAGGTDSTIDYKGTLVIGANETASSLTVTATSVYDTTKSGTATVTIGTATGS